jgi:hypothetical protein
LTGTVASECYSQSKDEVIFRFETHGKSFYIKANLGPALSLLSFPPTSERARKNSVDLFPGIIGYRVTDVTQYANERSFSIGLEDNKRLLFKMHGNRSNAILFENNIAVELFRNNLPADADIDINNLNRTIDWSYETFLQQHHEIEKLYFTFGRIVWLFLRAKGFFECSAPVKWEMVREIISQLENPRYYLTPVKSTIHLTLLEFENSNALNGRVLEIANRFFYSFTQEFVLEKERTEAISVLRNKLIAGQNYQDKNFQKLTEIERDTSYKNWADLIMANMHLIRQGQETISLPDFYAEGKQVEIKLKRDLSPQANAAVFYRKAKNQHIEIERLRQSLELKEKEIASIKETISELEGIADLKELRRKVSGLHLKSGKDSQMQSLPYHEFLVNGFRIWVGRNAQSNDELTLKYAYKEDLWLHAKDVAGSHVVIKFQSGKNFPKDVIERAAQLAAYNSKRKNETLCPVIVTPKKFVRKRKGDPAGAVIVEREEVVMVEPKL